MNTPFPYDGPEALAPLIHQALAQVVDPEVALNIVDLGLVYGVTARDGDVQVRMTMTSAACPVADLIVGEVEAELDRVLPADAAGAQALAPAGQDGPAPFAVRSIAVELVWQPAWSPECMSPRARAFMRW